MDRFAGKVAVVTGGASGIGEATVRRLVGEGAIDGFGGWIAILCNLAGPRHLHERQSQRAVHRGRIKPENATRAHRRAEIGK